MFVADNCMYPSPLSKAAHGLDHIVLFEFLGRILGKGKSRLVELTATNKDIAKPLCPICSVIRRHNNAAPVCPFLLVVSAGRLQLFPHVVRS